MMIHPSPTPGVKKWQIGVYCGLDASVERCLESLAHAGWKDAIRLFLEPGAVVPRQFCHLPVTRLDSELGGVARDLVIVSEMLMREPGAMAHLLVRGDVVVGPSGFRDDLESAFWPGESPGMLLLEGVEETAGEGWSKVSHRGDSRVPKAVVITTGAAREFLADRSVLETATTPLTSSDFLGSLQAWAFDRGLPIQAPDRDFVWCPQDSAWEHAEKNGVRLRVRDASVSIIVPTWNCGPFLRPCLRSLLDQTASAEVIVVDDASTDETSEVLSEFTDRIQLACHEERRGANAARNTGIRRATGDLIVMADADNEYSPSWLEKLLEAVLSAPDVGLAYCGFSRITEDGRKRRFASDQWDLHKLWYNNYIDMPSLLRREALPEEGLVEGFRPFDDWRLWLDMASRGWRGKLVQEDLYLKRVRKDSKTLRSKSFPADRAREVAQLRREFAHLVGVESPVAVVIPALGCEDLTVKCLAHVADFSGVPYVVYYVDNGSPLSALDEVVQAAEEHAVRLRILRNSENQGFTQAVNQGIEAAGDANVLVLNNDCFVGPNCIENLAYEMATREHVAAIGPVTCDRGGQSLRIPDHRYQAGVGGDVLDILTDPVETAARLLHRHNTVQREVLAFFCTLLNREALNRFGSLDDRFPSGLAADDEWCLRVRGHGWRTLLSYGAYAAHLHRSTFERFEIDRDALQQESKDTLRQVLAENGTIES